MGFVVVAQNEGHINAAFHADSRAEAHRVSERAQEIDNATASAIGADPWQWTLIDTLDEEALYALIRSDAQ